MSTVKTGWLKNNNGEKFAPKTLISQVVTNDGVTLENKLNEDYLLLENNITEKLTEAKTYAATAQTKADSAYTLAESKVDSLSDLGITATATELNYMDGVTSNVQTQLDGKASSAAATTSANGLMTSAMVTKLNGIAEGANKYSLPTASSSTLGGVKTTSTVTSNSGYTACPIISGVPYYKDTNTTYSLGSFGITATSAELNYCDGVTSNIQTQLNGKAASSHTHSYLPLSGGSISGDLSVNGVIQAYHIYDTTLAYGIGTGTARTYPYVQFRGSGNVGSNRELSLVYYDSSGAGHFNKLMDSSGNLCLQSASTSIKIHATNHVILSADGYALYFGVGITSGTIISLTPRTTSGKAADNKIVLGSSSSRWTTCFAKNGVSTSSDERDKDIFELDGRYKNLFMNTKPIIYRWNDDDSNIFHVGVGAQSYEASAHECGLTTEEVGAIRHDYWDEPNSDGRTDRYSINYDEVVMLAVPFVQEHEKKIQALEEENSTLKIELAELKELVQQLIA